MSSAAIFDLGIRLRAAETGTVKARLAGTPFVPVAPTVALDVTAAGQVTVQFDGGAPTVGKGPQALAPLAALVPTGAADEDRPMRTLAVTSRGVLRRAISLASQLAPSDPLFAVGSLLAWWNERLDHPDTQAALCVVDACRVRWVTGEHPDAERQFVTWLRWLGVDDAGTGAVLQVAALLRAGTPIGGLLAKDGSVNSDDRWAWSQLGRAVAGGFDWRAGDSQTRQVLGLLTRNTSSEVRERQLLNDSVWQARGRWEGTTVRGVVTTTGVYIGVQSRQTECKFKIGRMLVLRSSRRDADGNRIVARVMVDKMNTDPATGMLSVTVRALSKKYQGLTGLLVEDDRVLLLPEELTHAQQVRKRQTVQRSLAKPHWTRPGKAVPARVERDVPLDVIVAAHG